MKTIRIPFQFDSRGGIATVTNTQQIVEQQIVDILVTNRFERIMNPGYGANLNAFIFSPVRDVLLNTKAEEVRSLLSSTVHLAKISRVTLLEVPGLESTISLEVQYSILPSPTVFSLFKNVTGLVTDETAFGEII